MLETNTHGIEAIFGKPLLHDAESREIVLKIIAENFGNSDETTIICGHGNEQIPEYKEQMIELDLLVRSRFKNVFLATLEGQPKAEKAFADAKNTSLKKVFSFHFCFRRANTLIAT